MDAPVYVGLAYHSNEAVSYSIEDGVDAKVDALEELLWLTCQKSPSLIHILLIHGEHGELHSYSPRDSVNRVERTGDGVLDEGGSPLYDSKAKLEGALRDALNRLFYEVLHARGDTNEKTDRVPNQINRTQ